MEAKGREVKEERGWGARLARGVAGTTVCVDVVESDEDEDEEGVGEYERGEDGGCGVDEVEEETGTL